MTRADDERLAIVLLDHGSRRSEANAQLEELRARVSARLPGTLVVAAHLEVARPDLRQAIEECVRSGATRVVVHPFFLLPGNHTTRDVPEQIRAAAQRHPDVEIVSSEPLGLTDELVEIVLARIGETD